MYTVLVLMLAEAVGYESNNQCILSVPDDSAVSSSSSSQLRARYIECGEVHMLSNTMIS